MNDLAPVKAAENLPAMIEAAATRLAAAKSSGEVLEARDMAQVAFEAAKSAGRMARAKRAHDDVIAAAYRVQGDALAIQSRAKMRLADEYDAAQDRGEVATGRPKSLDVAETFQATASALGLRHDEIYEARQLRNIELEAPGIIEDAIQAVVQRGEEPSKAAVSREVDERRNVHVGNNSGNNEWYTPPEFIEAAREVLGGIDLDPASSVVANERVRASRIFTAEDSGLNQEWPVGNIWMNPPYAQPLVGQFADRFAAEIRRGSTGIVLVNNATETAWFQTLATVCSAICFPKTRIRFMDPTGKRSGAPLQGQAIIYCGENPEKFSEEFRQFGLMVSHEL